MGILLSMLTSKNRFCATEIRDKCSFWRIVSVSLFNSGPKCGPPPKKHFFIKKMSIHSVIDVSVIFGCITNLHKLGDLKSHLLSHRLSSRCQGAASLSGSLGPLPRSWRCWQNSILRVLNWGPCFSASPQQLQTHVIFCYMAFSQWSDSFLLHKLIIAFDKSFVETLWSPGWSCLFVQQNLHLLLP